MSDRKDMFSHSFTWLKVALAVFVVLCLLCSIVTHDIKTVFTEGLWIFTSTITGAGLVIGFLINAFTNFRKPVLFYATGHLLAVLVFCWLIWPRHDKSDTTKNSSLVSQPEDSLGRRIDLIAAAFDKEYPSTCNYDEIEISPLDSTSQSLHKPSEVYLVFHNNDEPGKYYFNKYLMFGDSVKMVFHNVPTTSPAYKEYQRKSEINHLLHQAGLPNK